MTSHKLLGQLLKEAGLLTDQQIKIALFDQAASGIRFGEILVKRGWIKPKTLEYFLAHAPSLSNTQAILEGGIPLERCVVGDQVIFRIVASDSAPPPSSDLTVSISELIDLDQFLQTIKQLEPEPILGE